MHVLYHYEEFLKVNSNGVNPVDANDVFFSPAWHDSMCQYAMYEVSKPDSLFNKS